MSQPVSTLSLKQRLRRYLSVLLPLTLLTPLPVSQAQPLALQAPAQPLPVEVTAPLQRVGMPLSQVALLVAPADGGLPLVSHNVTQAMNPASVMKLVTTGIALDQLGPGFHHLPRLFAQQRSGRIVNGVGADPDIVVASAKAYLSALNKLHSNQEVVAAQG